MVNHCGSDGIGVFAILATFFRTRFGKIGLGSDKLESAPSEAVENQLDNPAWPKVSHPARTELDVYGGNDVHKAQGKANGQP